MSSSKHGIDRNTLKYLVFAGNYRQFGLWCDDNNIAPGEALFVASRTNLLTVYGDEYILVRVGTFHLRPDAQDIMEEARVRFPNCAWEEYSLRFALKGWHVYRRHQK
jgi:hypothetical protein